MLNTNSAKFFNPNENQHKEQLNDPSLNDPIEV